MAAIETFVEDCLAILEKAPPRVPEGRRIVPGTFWLSVSTRRRCVVLWATHASVCLSYDETNPNARKVHRLQDFERLYLEVQ